MPKFVQFQRSKKLSYGDWEPLEGETGGDPQEYKAEHGKHKSGTDTGYSDPTAQRVLEELTPHKEKVEKKFTETVPFKAINEAGQAQLSPKQLQHVQKQIDTGIITIRDIKDIQLDLTTGKFSLGKYTDLPMIVANQFIEAAEATKLAEVNILTGEMKLGSTASVSDMETYTSYTRGSTGVMNTESGLREFVSERPLDKVGVSNFEIDVDSRLVEKYTPVEGDILGRGTKVTYGRVEDSIKAIEDYIRTDLDTDLKPRHPSEIQHIVYELEQDLKELNNIQSNAIKQINQLSDNPQVKSVTSGPVSIKIENAIFDETGTQKLSGNINDIVAVHPDNMTLRVASVAKANINVSGEQQSLKDLESIKSQEREALIATGEDKRTLYVKDAKSLTEDDLYRANEAMPTNPPIRNTSFGLIATKPEIKEKYEKIDKETGEVIQEAKASEIKPHITNISKDIPGYYEIVKVNPVSKPKVTETIPEVKHQLDKIKELKYVSTWDFGRIISEGLSRDIDSGKSYSILTKYLRTSPTGQINKALPGLEGITPSQIFKGVEGKALSEGLILETLRPQTKGTPVKPDIGNGGVVYRQGGDVILGDIIPEDAPKSVASAKVEQVMFDMRNKPSDSDKTSEYIHREIKPNPKEFISSWGTVPVEGSIQIDVSEWDPVKEKWIDKYITKSGPYSSTVGLDKYKKIQTFGTNLESASRFPHWGVDFRNPEEVDFEAAKKNQIEINASNIIKEYNLEQEFKDAWFEQENRQNLGKSKIEGKWINYYTEAEYKVIFLDPSYIVTRKDIMNKVAPNILKGTDLSNFQQDLKTVSLNVPADINISGSPLTGTGNIKSPTIHNVSLSKTEVEESEWYVARGNVPEEMEGLYTHESKQSLSEKVSQISKEMKLTGQQDWIQTVNREMHKIVDAELTDAGKKDVNWSTKNIYEKTEYLVNIGRAKKATVKDVQRTLQKQAILNLEKQGYQFYSPGGKVPIKGYKNILKNIKW